MEYITIKNTNKQESLKENQSVNFLKMSKLKILLMVMGFMSMSSIYAQVAIGHENPDESAILDIESSTQGVLPPRMTTTERNAISNPAKGLVLFNETENCLQVNQGTPATPDWQCMSAQPYQQIRGKTTKVTSSSYTVQPDDHLIYTMHNAQVTITFPSLTDTDADRGRMVYVHNNNSTFGSTLYSGTIVGQTVTNQYRGRIFCWTGTYWAVIGL